MMENKISTYVRCVGMLYVRFIVDPTQLWRLLSKYLEAEESRVSSLGFFPSASNDVDIRLGDFVERLLSDNDYFATRLPRIPTLIEREIKKNLEENKERKDRKQWNLEHIVDFTEGSLLEVYSSQVG